MEHSSILSERKETTHASPDTFEEIYMINDISEKNYEPSIGIPFMYPQRWQSDGSQNKKIAIRRLSKFSSKG